MKSIEFNLKNGIAYINSSSLTTIGLWISTPPFLKVDWTALSTAEKYNILMEAFDESKSGLLMPDNPKGFGKSIVKNFGFNNWSKFYEGGRQCSIRSDPETQQYIFTPMIYLRVSQSLYGIKDAVESIAIVLTP